MRINSLVITIVSAIAGTGVAFSPSLGSHAFVARSGDFKSASSLSMSDDAFVPETAEVTQARIQELVDNNPVLLFMKGSKIFPQCGFSSTAVQILSAYNIDFHTVGEFSSFRKCN